MFEDDRHLQGIIQNIKVCVLCMHALNLAGRLIQKMVALESLMYTNYILKFGLILFLSIF